MMNSVTNFDMSRFDGTKNFILWQQRVETKPQGLEDRDYVVL